MNKYRRHRGKRSRRTRKKVSESTATYVDLLDFTGSTSGTANTTTVQSVDFNGVHNDGETVNRKIIGVHGALAYCCQPSAGHYVAAMFALWAHPELESVPSISDFDPFQTGPQGAVTSYKGRMSPRPFGRRQFLHALQTGGTATQLFSEERYHSKSERLLRPGWSLSGLLYLKSSSTSQSVKLVANLRTTVIG